MTRVSVLTLIAAASCLTVYGCSGSNASTGGTTSAGAAATSAGSGNTTAGSTSAAGATSVAGSTSTDGGSSSGGAPAASAGAAGMSTGTAGGTGTAGSFMPLCAGLTTAAGAAPTKGGACTPTDAQSCYKTCGPQASGFKSETCTNGVYVEMSGCTFPDTLDATCFKLPAAQDASCPATTPQASTDCTVAACTLCNLGGGPTGTYLDSKSMMKVGYCVCPMASASGSRKWSCATKDAWPCPGAKGC